jgi:hypothetical protein
MPPVQSNYSALTQPSNSIPPATEHSEKRDIKHEYKTKHPKVANSAPQTQKIDPRGSVSPSKSENPNSLIPRP